MLADYLVEHRQELVRQVEVRFSAEGRAGQASEHRARIDALVGELIEALLAAGGQQTPPATVGASRDASLQWHERDLVRLETIAAVARHAIPVCLHEMVVLSDWASAAEREHLEDTVRRLSDLLDDVGEGAVIVSADGRLEYLNRVAAAALHGASGVPFDQLLGKTNGDLGLQRELPSPGTLVALGRRRATQLETLLGRWNQTKYRAIRSVGGNVDAVAVVSHDVHEPWLLGVRLELLSKLSAMVGWVDYETVAEALASVPIPEIADCCIVHLVEDGRVVRTCIAHGDPANTALRDATTRTVYDWSANPLWTEMRLTSGFQLLTHVSDELLRAIAFDEEQYRVMARVGVRSAMVQPVASHSQIIAMFTLLYTAESGRRYGTDDPKLTAELAHHSAHIVENSRLLKDLRMSEARFRVSLAGAKTGVFEQDSSLRYRWAYNPCVPFNLIGKKDEDCFQADDAGLMTALKRRVLESGESSREELSVTVGGERHSYRQATEAMRDPAGKVVGIIGSATDITNEKRVQRQLSEAVGFRDVMMGVLGHDLRNPLHAVKMATAAVLRQDVSEAVRKKMQVIQQAAGRMSEMIATLLDLTQVHAQGSLPVTRERIDLGDRAREVVDEASAAWPDRSIELEVLDDVRGQWDPARIAQAISNLVANALQHGDARKPVHVSIDGRGEPVVLKVTNEGPPIPSEMMPVIFEPFSHGEGSPRGLGLGLFIVRQIAMSHSGTVSVESTPEAGTIFTMVLPRAA